MARNPFFNFYNHASEQNLHEDLIIESIQIFGLDFIYIIRDEKSPKLLYGENPLSVFKNTFEIEMYLESVDGFEGDKQMFSTMGFESRDSARLVCAKRRFHKEMPDTMFRPREGDLLYFPMDHSIHEIHLVTDEEIFYQMGNLPVYKLNIEKFEYSHEDFDTTYDILNNLNKDFKYSYEIELGTGSGSFDVDDIVYVGDSVSLASASARVHSYDPDLNLLRIYKVRGEFTSGTLRVVNSPTVYEFSNGEPLDILQDKNTDNKLVEDDSKKVLDYTEKDPFSDGDY